VNNQDLIKLFGIRFQPEGFPDNERSHLVFFRGVCVFSVSQLARSLAVVLSAEQLGNWMVMELARRKGEKLAGMRSPGIGDGTTCPALHV
jgi:hypothetical protein